MKKQILNLGRALNKAEQKEIQGGGGFGQSNVPYIAQIGSGITDSATCVCTNESEYGVDSCDECDSVCSDNNPGAQMKVCSGGGN